MAARRRLAKALGRLHRSGLVLSRAPQILLGGQRSYGRRHLIGWTVGRKRRPGRACPRTEAAGRCGPGQPVGDHPPNPCLDQQDAIAAGIRQHLNEAVVQPSAEQYGRAGAIPERRRIRWTISVRDLRPNVASNSGSFSDQIARAVSPLPRRRAPAAVRREEYSSAGVVIVEVRLPADAHPPRFKNVQEVVRFSVSDHCPAGCQRPRLEEHGNPLPLRSR